MRSECMTYEEFLKAKKDFHDVSDWKVKHQSRKCVGSENDPIEVNEDVPYSVQEGFV